MKRDPETNRAVSRSMARVSKSRDKRAEAGKSTPTHDGFNREQLEFYLAHLAHYDVLTDLPNRSQFYDRLRGAMARAARHNHMAGILLINLDHFRSVNIKHGYGTGDGVLRQVGERVKECARESDTVARLGGDEFAVILEDLADKEDAIVPAQRILDALARPMTGNGSQIQVTATIGIALFPSDGRDLDGLLRTADTAMCDAKDHRRNSYRFYSPSLDFKTLREETRRAEIHGRLSRLTPREREVLEVLIAGKANKMIAFLLGASIRTIENHRARIMEKMQAQSLPELVRMVLDHHRQPLPPARTPDLAHPCG